MATDILTWWLVLQLFGLVGLPLAAFLFRSLPDRGYAFSKSLGLLLTGYGTWLLAMFGLGNFGVPLVLFVLAMLGVGGLLLLRTYWQVPLSVPALAARLRDWLRASWRGILAYELLFLLALVLLAWVRSYQPHPWGTERPMDFAFFNAIRYSVSFPPADPWLAGYSINYYYFGYMLMAIVALLSGLEPATAFNLALAGIFALTALGVAGVVANLVLLNRASQQQAQSEQPEQPAIEESEALEAGAETEHSPHPQAPEPTLPLFLAALLGAVMVLLAGNQAGALQVLVGDHRVVALEGHQLVSAVGQALGGTEDPIDLPYPVLQASELGTFSTLENGDTFHNFNWWWPSRALWDAYAPGADPYTVMLRYNITEFPFFSFWLGDMHPHVMALPFDLLALALALALVSRAALPRFTADWSGWLELLLTGIILGSLYTINSWDLPTYILLYMGALLLLYARLSGLSSGQAWRSLGQQAGLVVLALVLLFVPFYLTFHSLVGFAEPWINIPVLASLSQIIAPFVEDKSGLHAFLIIFGLFLLPLVAFVYLSADTGEKLAHSMPDEPAADPEPHEPPPRPLWKWLLSPWPALVLLLIGLLIGFPLLALVGLAIFAFKEALQRPDLPAERFVLLVVALGCAICFGTELIYIRDVFSNRMNTIFKFYYQVWLLWGTMAAFAAWWLATRAAQPVALPGTLSTVQRAVITVLGAVFLVLLAGGLLYPAINLRDMTRHGMQVGLEGDTPRENTEAGDAATRWIRQNTPQGSVVLEAVHPDGGSYNVEGYGGVAASTGRPTVLGWYGHEVQWRGGDTAAIAELEPRKQDVEEIYRTTNPQRARELLDKYNVRYVYVGSLERRRYPPESLATFDQIANPVFQMEDVTIYELPINLDD